MKFFFIISAFYMHVKESESALAKTKNVAVRAVKFVEQKVTFKNVLIAYSICFLIHFIIVFFFFQQEWIFEIFEKFSVFYFLQFVFFWVSCYVVFKEKLYKNYHILIILFLQLILYFEKFYTIEDVFYAKNREFSCLFFYNENGHSFNVVYNLNFFNKLWMFFNFGVTNCEDIIKLIVTKIKEKEPSNFNVSIKMLECRNRFWYASGFDKGKKEEIEKRFAGFFIDGFEKSINFENYCSNSFSITLKFSKTSVKTQE